MPYGSSNGGGPGLPGAGQNPGARIGASVNGNGTPTLDKTKSISYKSDN